MTNAEQFKKTFGIYAEEFWSYTGKQMLVWINTDVPDTNVGDMISRQAAIDAFEKRTHIDWESLKILHPMFEVLEELPSAERRGRWIMRIDDLFPEESMMECDQCHEEQPLTCDDNYCPNCGAKMDKSQEVKGE